MAKMTEHEYLNKIAGEPPRERPWAASDPEERYIRFRETNNWEAERWNFYIPLRGNEEAVRALADAVEKVTPQGGCFIGEHTPYDIRLVPTPPDKVDRLCESGRGGYMAYHNRLEGRLDIRSVRAARRMGGDGDPLYKGGLMRMMRPWGKRRRPKETDWPTGRHEADLRRLEMRGLYKKTAGRLFGNGARASGVFGFRLGRPRASFEDRCWDAVLRLEAADLRTVDDVAKLTKKQLLATPGVGRATAELAAWMLGDAGLAAP
jgi:hypothetical protein